MLGAGAHPNLNVAWSVGWLVGVVAVVVWLVACWILKHSGWSVEWLVPGLDGHTQAQILVTQAF